MLIGFGLGLGVWLVSFSSLRVRSRGMSWMGNDRHYRHPAGLETAVGETKWSEACLAWDEGRRCTWTVGSN